MPRAKNAPKAPTMPATALTPRKRRKVARIITTMEDIELEREYQKAITDYMELLGYYWCHIPDSRHGAGTPGAPDIFAGHPVTLALLTVEVKLDRGVESVGQYDWADMLIRMPHVEYYYVTQSDWERFKKVLEEKAGRVAA